MPLARDLSHLPVAQASANLNWAPDKTVRFMHVLAEKWMAEDRRVAKAADTRFRHSDGGGCSRAIAYAALELPWSNPVDISGIHVMERGRILHELLQEALRERYGMAAEIDCLIDGFDGSGHADGLIISHLGPRPDAQAWPGKDRRVIVAEYKTVGGYTYKLAVGERSEPRGPRWMYVVQGALNAKALNADELVIGLLSVEAISKQVADRKHYSDVQRFCAEWTLTREEYEPIARAEIERVSTILAGLDEGELPPRTIPDPEMPANHVITDPRKGIWVEYDNQGHPLDSKTTWHCAYCRWQNVCATTDPGRVTLSGLKQTLGGADDGTKGQNPGAAAGQDVEAHGTP